MEIRILKLLFKLLDQNKGSFSSGFLINSTLLKPVWTVFCYLYPKVLRVSFLCEALLHPFPFPECSMLPLCCDLFLHYYCRHLTHGSLVSVCISTILKWGSVWHLCTTATALLTAAGLHDLHFTSESPWPPGYKLNTRRRAKTMSISLYSSTPNTW